MEEGKKISSGQAFFLKKVFPKIWFGFLGLWILMALPAVLSDPASESLPALVLIMPVMMAVFGHFMFKYLLYGLADEVYDYGDHLLVKNKGEHIKIFLTNIKNISFAAMNPPKITLLLNEETDFGQEVEFSPKRKMFEFFSNEIAKDLTERVHEARSKNDS